MSLVINGSAVVVIGPVTKVKANNTAITTVVANGQTVWTWTQFNASWSGDWIGGVTSTARFGVSVSGAFFRAGVSEANQGLLYGGWLSVSSTGSLGYGTSTTPATSAGSKFQITTAFNTISWDFYLGPAYTWYSSDASCSYNAFTHSFSGSARFPLDTNQGFFTSGGLIKSVANGYSSTYRSLT